MKSHQYEQLTPEGAEARLKAEIATGRQAVRHVLAGPEMLDPEQIGSRLGISTASVDQLRRERRLLGLSANSVKWRYPAWQLCGREILPGLDRLLAVARHGPWQVYRVLLTGHPETDGRTGLQALLDGEVEAVLAAIRALNTSAGGAD